MTFSSLQEIVKNKDNIIYIVGNKIVFKNNPEVEEDFSVNYNGKYIDFINIDLNVDLYELFSDFIAVRTKRLIQMNETGNTYIDSKGQLATYLIINKEYFDNGLFGEVYPLNTAIPTFNLLSGVFKAYQSRMQFSEIKTKLKLALADKPELCEKLNMLYSVRNGITFDGYNLLVSSTTSLTSIIDNSDIKYFVLYKNKDKNMPIVIAHDTESKYKVIYVYNLEKYTELDILRERYKNDVYNKTYSVFDADLSSDKLIKFSVSENSELFVNRVYLSLLVKLHPEQVFRNKRAYIGDYSFGETYFKKQVADLYDFTEDSLADITKAIYAKTSKKSVVNLKPKSEPIGEKPVVEVKPEKSVFEFIGEDPRNVAFIFITNDQIVWVSKNKLTTKTAKKWRQYKCENCIGNLPHIDAELLAAEFYAKYDESTTRTNDMIFAYNKNIDMFEAPEEIIKYLNIDDKYEWFNIKGNTISKSFPIYELVHSLYEFLFDKINTVHEIESEKSIDYNAEEMEDDLAVEEVEKEVSGDDELVDDEQNFIGTEKVEIEDHAVPEPSLSVLILGNCLVVHEIHTFKVIYVKLNRINCIERDNEGLIVKTKYGEEYRCMMDEETLKTVLSLM